MSQLSGYISTHMQRTVSCSEQYLLKTRILRYISGIYIWYKLSFYSSWYCSQILAGPLSLPASLGCLRPGLLADHLGFGHRQATDAGLGAAECPPPRVDLVKMASST